MKFEEVSLEDVADITKLAGFEFTKYFQYKEEGDIIAIRGLNVKNGFLDLSTVKYIDKEVSNSLPRSKLYNNDIVLTYTGSKYGDVALIEKNNKFHLAPNVAKISIKKNYNPYFYYMVFQSPQFQYYLKNFGVGSGQPTIPMKTIRKIPVPLPTLEVQDKIATMMKNINKKVELNNQMIATLEELAATLFKRWFVDFEFPDENGNPYKSSGGKMVDSELGEIPEGWEVTTIGNLMVNFDRKRIPLSKMERSKRQGEYPYYGAASVMDYVDDFLFDGTYLLLGEDGTVSTSEGYPILQYVYGKFWVNNHAHVLQGNEDLGISTEWIKLWFSFQKVSTIITGAVQPKISQKNLNSMLVVHPSKKITDVFNGIINPFYFKLKNLEVENKILEEIRDLTLPKLISGEVVL
ncbi:restriction endonuclease subunit S [Enterococcus faecium]|nr:restriction endonuclease subunit S [Enterococcus faecium]EMF0559735.1 restriction endonuclease subunit S [Enterococcus faecium]